jgi:hypothetical protein
MVLKTSDRASTPTHFAYFSKTRAKEDMNWRSVEI